MVKFPIDTKIDYIKDLTIKDGTIMPSYEMYTDIIRSIGPLSHRINMYYGNISDEEYYEIHQHYVEGQKGHHFIPFDDNDEMALNKINRQDMGKFSDGTMKMYTLPDDDNSADQNALRYDKTDKYSTNSKMVYYKIPCNLSIFYENGTAIKTTHREQEVQCDCGKTTEEYALCESCNTYCVNKTIDIKPQRLYEIFNMNSRGKLDLPILQVFIDGRKVPDNEVYGYMLPESTDLLIPKKYFDNYMGDVNISQNNVCQVHIERKTFTHYSYVNNYRLNFTPKSQPITTSNPVTYFDITFFLTAKQLERNIFPPNGKELRQRFLVYSNGRLINTTFDITEPDKIASVRPADKQVSITIVNKGTTKATFDIIAGSNIEIVYDQSICYNADEESKTEQFAIYVDTTKLEAFRDVYGIVPKENCMFFISEVGESDNPNRLGLRIPVENIYQIGRSHFIIPSLSKGKNDTKDYIVSIIVTNKDIDARILRNLYSVDYYFSNLIGPQRTVKALSSGTAMEISKDPNDPNGDNNIKDFIIQLNSCIIDLKNPKYTSFTTNNRLYQKMLTCNESLYQYNVAVNIRDILEKGTNSYTNAAEPSATANSLLSYYGKLKYLIEAFPCGTPLLREILSYFSAQEIYATVDVDAKTDKGYVTFSFDEILELSPKYKYIYLVELNGIYLHYSEDVVFADFNDYTIHNPQGLEILANHNDDINIIKIKTDKFKKNEYSCACGTETTTIAEDDIRLPKDKMINRVICDKCHTLVKKATNQIHITKLRSNLVNDSIECVVIKREGSTFTMVNGINGQILGDPIEVINYQVDGITFTFLTFTGCKYSNDYICFSDTIGGLINYKVNKGWKYLDPQQEIVSFVVGSEYTTVKIKWPVPDVNKPNEPEVNVIAIQNTRFNSTIHHLAITNKPYATTNYDIFLYNSSAYNIPIIPRGSIKVFRTNKTETVRLFEGRDYRLLNGTKSVDMYSCSILKLTCNVHHEDEIIIYLSDIENKVLLSRYAPITNTYGLLYFGDLPFPYSPRYVHLYINNKFVYPDEIEILSDRLIRVPYKSQSMFNIYAETAFAVDMANIEHYWKDNNKKDIMDNNFFETAMGDLFFTVYFSENNKRVVDNQTAAFTLWEKLSDKKSINNGPNPDIEDIGITPKRDGYFLFDGQLNHYGKIVGYEYRDGNVEFDGTLIHHGYKEEWNKPTSKYHNTNPPIEEYVIDTLDFDKDSNTDIAAFEKLDEERYKPIYFPNDEDPILVGMNERNFDLQESTGLYQSVAEAALYRGLENRYFRELMERTNYLLQEAFFDYIDDTDFEQVYNENIQRYELVVKEDAQRSIDIRIDPTETDGDSVGTVDTFNDTMFTELSEQNYTEDDININNILPVQEKYIESEYIDEIYGKWCTVNKPAFPLVIVASIANKEMTDLVQRVNHLNMYTGIHESLLAGAYGFIANTPIVIDEKLFMDELEKTIKDTNYVTVTEDGTRTVKGERDPEYDPITVDDNYIPNKLSKPFIEFTNGINVVEQESDSELIYNYFYAITNVAGIVKPLTFKIHHNSENTTRIYYTINKKLPTVNTTFYRYDDTFEVYDSCTVKLVVYDTTGNNAPSQVVTFNFVVKTTEPWLSYNGMRIPSDATIKHTNFNPNNLDITHFQNAIYYLDTIIKYNTINIPTTKPNTIIIPNEDTIEIDYMLCNPTHKYYGAGIQEFQPNKSLVYQTINFTGDFDEKFDKNDKITKEIVVDKTTLLFMRARSTNPDTVSSEIVCCCLERALNIPIVGIESNPIINYDFGGIHIYPNEDDPGIIYETPLLYNNDTILILDDWIEYQDNTRYRIKCVNKDDKLSVRSGDIIKLSVTQNSGSIGRVAIKYAEDVNFIRDISDDTTTINTKKEFTITVSGDSNTYKTIDFIGIATASKTENTAYKIDITKIKIYRKYDDVFIGANMLKPVYPAKFSQLQQLNVANATTPPITCTFSLRIIFETMLANSININNDIGVEIMFNYNVECKINHNLGFHITVEDIFNHDIIELAPEEVDDTKLKKFYFTMYFNKAQIHDILKATENASYIIISNRCAVIDISDLLQRADLTYDVQRIPEDYTDIKFDNIDDIKNRIYIDENTKIKAFSYGVHYVPSIYSDFKNYEVSLTTPVLSSPQSSLYNAYRINCNPPVYNPYNNAKILFGLDNYITRGGNDFGFSHHRNEETLRARTMRINTNHSAIYYEPVKSNLPSVKLTQPSIAPSGDTPRFTNGNTLSFGDIDNQDDNVFNTANVKIKLSHPRYDAIFYVTYTNENDTTPGGYLMERELGTYYTNAGNNIETDGIPLSNHTIITIVAQAPDCTPSDPVVLHCKQGMPQSFALEKANSSNADGFITNDINNIIDNNAENVQLTTPTVQVRFVSETKLDGFVCLYTKTESTNDSGTVADPAVIDDTNKATCLALTYGQTLTIDRNTKIRIRMASPDRSTLSDVTPDVYKFNFRLSAPTAPSSTDVMYNQNGSFVISSVHASNIHGNTVTFVTTHNVDSSGYGGNLGAQSGNQYVFNHSGGSPGVVDASVKCVGFLPSANMGEKLWRIKLNAPAISANTDVALINNGNKLALSSISNPNQNATGVSVYICRGAWENNPVHGVNETTSNPRIYDSASIMAYYAHKVTNPSIDDPKLFLDSADSNIVKPIFTLNPLVLKNVTFYYGTTSTISDASKSNIDLNNNPNGTEVWRAWDQNNPNVTNNNSVYQTNDSRWFTAQARYPNGKYAQSTLSTMNYQATLPNNNTFETLWIGGTGIVHRNDFTHTMTEEFPLWNCAPTFNGYVGATFFIWRDCGGYYDWSQVGFSTNSIMHFSKPTNGHYFEEFKVEQFYYKDNYISSDSVTKMLRIQWGD